MCPYFLSTVNLLLGVAIGLLTIPLSEKIKRHNKSQESIKNFFLELDEFLVQLKPILRNLYRTYEFVHKINLTKKIPEKYRLRLGPRTIVFITTDTVINNSFSDLSHDLRVSIRAINTLAEVYNKNSPLLDDLDNLIKTDPLRMKNQLENIIRDLGSLYWLLSELSNKRERFIYPENKDPDDLALTALKTLDIEFS